MRNKYIQSPEKIIDRILNYPHKEKGCSYICGPHLEPCVMVRAHDGDCECRECNANSPFRIAAQEYRQQSGHKSDNQDIQMSHLAKERVKSNKQMTNEVKAAVDRLRAVPVGHNDSDAEVYDAIQTVITALQSATARADRAEAVREFVDRLAADLDKCKGWHGIKEDDLHVGLMDFAKHRAREVAAEMGISLEGK